MQSAVVELQRFLALTRRAKQCERATGQIPAQGLPCSAPFAAEAENGDASGRQVS